MRLKIKYSPLSVQDLIDINDYISIRLAAPETAKTQIGDIIRAINRLPLFPEKCPLAQYPLLTVKGARKLLVNNYIVFYTLDKRRQIINIARVLYAKRKFLGLYKFL